MSDKELNRVNVIQAVCEKRLRRQDAAGQLGLTERQVQRLVNRYRESGTAGLAHGHRGKPGNHCLPESFKLHVLALVRQYYPDFGPTLAAEKLRERHSIVVSVETLRKWMTADGLWVPYVRRKPRVYQPRNRRDCLGELIQIDGSPHDWFEGRAPKCCLLVFIDDATGQLMHLRFGETESAFDYMLATREYIDKHGKPLVFYSDKHGIFRVNHPNGALTGTTQFGRVLHDIGVDLICANSPQAKGRVERANQTLQDRLIKEMRLEGIQWLLNQGKTYGFGAKLKEKVDYLYRSCTGVLKDQTDLFRLTYALEVVKATGWKYILLSDKLWKDMEGHSQTAAAMYIQQSQLDACFNDDGHQVAPLEMRFVGNPVALVNMFAECELTLAWREETIKGLHVAELQLHHVDEGKE